MTKKEAKASASRLRRELNNLQRPVSELNHSAVCELLARTLGYKSWSALRARLTKEADSPRKAETPLKVWLATYEHRHGTSTRVFGSESGALAWQWELADEWWEAEFPDEPRPPDNKIADEYFSGMADADKDMESFCIEKVSVESEELPSPCAPSQLQDDFWPVIRYGEAPLTVEVMDQMPAYRKIAVVEVRLTHCDNQPDTVANIDQEWLVGECVKRMTGREHGLCGVRVDETSIANPTKGCLAFRVTALEVDYESLERELGNNVEK